MTKLNELKSKTIQLKNLMSGLQLGIKQVYHQRRYNSTFGKWLQRGQKMHLKNGNNLRNTVQAKIDSGV